AGPVGASVPYLVFDPGGMSFEDYFGFAGKSDLEKSVLFLVGLAPALAQRGHFIDDRYLNFKAKKGASLGPTCMACAGVTGIEVLKLLLNRGKTYYVPWAMQFDMYRNRYHKRYNWRGNNNPLSQMKIRLMMQWAEAKADTIPAEEKGYRRALDRILDVARWAPSGDNCQPWFLTLRNDTAFQMDLGRFKQNVYNLLPMPDYISTGMFIENARIAAEKEGYDLDWTTAEDQVAVTLKKAKKKPENPLYPYIPTRSVNRYVYKPKKLLPTVRTALTAAVDDGIRITWFESFADKRKIADLMMRTTDIRLRLPETFPIHSTLIDWSGQDSADRIPAAAAGVNPLALKMMKWALGDQTRNEKLMKLPGSTASFMLELDLLPGLLCAGHFVMSFDPDKTPAPEVADYIRAGQSMQRFWLTLSRYGMALQPWYIPVMFSRYVAEDIPFTTDEKLLAKAQLLRDRLCEGVLAPRDLRLEDVFFTGRIGYPFKTPQARSVRKPFEDLIVTDKRGEKPAETV
ncbi:MAG: hypothetical protein KDJ15_04810, partial [Alphaproteobacteria bacterium]|nr:hypothetical protein [Alphaproteobacteria bacterium]